MKRYSYQVDVSAAEFDLGYCNDLEEAKEKLKKILNLPELGSRAWIYEAKVRRRPSLKARRKRIEKKVEELRSKFIADGKIRELFREAIRFGQSFSHEDLRIIWEAITQYVENTEEPVQDRKEQYPDDPATIAAEKELERAKDIMHRLDEYFAV
jgi:hypothetical protein